MKTEDVMDPAASPVRAGVRRVNNVPVWILGAAIAVFLGIMAYVAASRAVSREGSQEEAPVRSAVSVAKNITADYEAGIVPGATAGAPSSAPSKASGRDDQHGGDAQASPLTSAGKGSFPGPPLPPRLSDAPGADDLLPPANGAPGASQQSLAQDATGAYENSGSSSEDARALDRIKFEMFTQAVRAKTGTILDGSESRSGDSKRAAPLADGRTELAVAQAQEGYMHKLRQLQEAGLLPTGEAPEGDGRATGDDAYAQFAGAEGQDRWALGSRLQAPGSPYELRAGAVIPATLQTGINSDLPGQITALVAQDVRDTATGKYVLIPQASRLVGTYGSDVKFGQERVLVAWQRIVWPDGKALDIGAMPGSDGAGYSGFKDLVDNHFWRLLGSAVLLSGITGGIAYSQDSQAQAGDGATVSGAMSQALGQQLGQLSEEMIRKQMNVAPTIEIRPGYRFNVQVTKDLTFNGPYRAFDYQRSISADAQIFRQRP